MNASEQHVKQLTAIGFLAVGQGLNAEGEAIFNGLKVYRPDSEYPPIGLALNHIGSRRYDAVSYTHLDVYKRQCLDRRTRI